MTEAPAEHVLLIGLPKSANVFIRNTLMETLGLQSATFVIPGVRQIVNPMALFNFVEGPPAVGGQHMAPDDYNLDLLDGAGLHRIVLLVRDPRDALVSWWHHLQRPDIAAARWVHADQEATGAVTSAYRGLDRVGQMDELIENLFPKRQAWLSGWNRIQRSDSRFEVHLVRYEDFRAQPEATLSAILTFLGHDHSIVLPTIERPAGGGIDPKTHFRRGESGSHRDELLARQVERLRSLADRDLFSAFGWTL